MFKAYCSLLGINTYFFYGYGNSWRYGVLDCGKEFDTGFGDGLGRYCGDGVGIDRKKYVVEMPDEINYNGETYLDGFDLEDA